MSLPETLGFGTAIGAQAAQANSLTLNKANYGKYVAATNEVDTSIQLSCASAQRKDGVLDTWLRFEQFRNNAYNATGIPLETQNDRVLSVQFRVIAPLSTNSGLADGRFTQSEIIYRARSMGSILYEANFLERLFRGEL